MIWINRRKLTRTCKENNMLYGPFAEELPNFQSYIDTDDEETNADFCFPIEGYEAPYGKSTACYDRRYSSNTGSSDKHR